MKDINITIVNWKMKEDIDLCLKSLFSDIQGSELNIAVHIIDNSENADGIKGLLEVKYPQVIYHNPGGNIGFGKAQNMGFGMAEARYYLALNPDCEFQAGMRIFARLIKFMEDNPRAGIIGPKLLNIDGSIQESCLRFPKFWDQIIRRLNLDKKIKFLKKRVDYYLMRDFDHNSTQKVDWMIGAFLFVRKEMVDNIGFFDDRYFMYFEDCDWCRRAWLNNWEVHYIHDVVVKHGHVRESAKGSQVLAILKNPVSRIHLKSWLKYFWKWRFKKAHFGY